MPQPNLISLGVAGDVQDLSEFGRKYGERWVEGLTREDRAASGKLRRDNIAFKKAFTITYETIDQAVVDRLAVIFEDVNEELTLEVTQISTMKSYQVLLSPYSQDRLLAVWDGLWEAVTLEFQEV